MTFVPAFPSRLLELTPQLGDKPKPCRVHLVNNNVECFDDATLRAAQARASEFALFVAARDASEALAAEMGSTAAEAASAAGAASGLSCCSCEGASSALPSPAMQVATGKANSWGGSRKVRSR